MIWKDVSTLIIGPFDKIEYIVNSERGNTIRRHSTIYRWEIQLWIVQAFVGGSGGNQYPVEYGLLSFVTDVAWRIDLAMGSSDVQDSYLFIRLYSLHCSDIRWLSVSFNQVFAPANVPKIKCRLDTRRFRSLNRYLYSAYCSSTSNYYI